MYKLMMFSIVSWVLILSGCSAKNPSWNNEDTIIEEQQDTQTGEENSIKEEHEKMLKNMKAVLWWSWAKFGSIKKLLPNNTLEERGTGQNISEFIGLLEKSNIKSKEAFIPNYKIIGGTDGIALEAEEMITSGAIKIIEYRDNPLGSAQLKNYEKQATAREEDNIKSLVWKNILVLIPGEETKLYGDIETLIQNNTPSEDTNVPNS